MATAKIREPKEFDATKRDAQSVDIWLARMTTYLRLTQVAEGEKVETASWYLDETGY